MTAASSSLLKNGSLLLIAIPMLTGGTLSRPCVAGDNARRAPTPDILVVRDGWKADRDTVRKVLEYTARELWKFFPDRDLKPILVYPKGGPIVLYQRGPAGETVVRLDTGGTFWAQYAFQFGHEFCHILCKTDQDNHGNDWLEESLCDTACLFAVRQMGQSWKTDPPFAHWKGFAPNLTAYANDIIENARLGKGQTLASWYANHAETLHGSANNRKLNRVIAVALLPLFEAEPEHWQAVTWLNAAKPPGQQTLTEYLTDWRNNVPPRHRAFVERIAAEFGLVLSADTLQMRTHDVRGDAK